MASAHASATATVHHAILAGRLPRQSDAVCVDCGTPAEHYHHHLGYSREHWLDVVALCRACHKARHEQERIRRYTLALEARRWDGKKVKFHLVQQGRSMTWLARQMGAERSAFVHTLMGDRPPKDPLFWERIAGILGVSITAIHADPERVA